MDAPNRPITDAELALIQAVVDARDDNKRVPDDFIRSCARRVASECVTPAEMTKLQVLYTSMRAAAETFNEALEQLPPYAQSRTLGQLKSTYENDTAHEEPCK